MSDNFYCAEVLSGRTVIDKVAETPNVLAFYHTRPAYPVHIVVIPKRHIASLTALEAIDSQLLLEMIDIIKQISVRIVNEHGVSGRDEPG